jgi:hypothetical protein
MKFISKFIDFVTNGSQTSNNTNTHSLFIAAICSVFQYIVVELLLYVLMTSFQFWKQN